MRRPLAAFFAFFAFIAALALLPASACASDDEAPEPVMFDGWPGPALKVYALRPAAAADAAPVVFVMHGVKRDADRYFAEWRPLAEKHGFVLIVPEFSSAAFPGAAHYNLGGVGEVGARAAASAFAAIEPLFDAMKARFGLSADQYVLYGHSAGAQFAHRFAMFGEGPRARLIIAANAGWYTFPEDGEWPYGPAGLQAGEFDADGALAAPLVVLAGEADTDPNHPSLRRTDEAMAQGATRLDRAKAFFEAGAALAARKGAAFHWACVTAPGVDHNDAKAAPFAAALILHGVPVSKGSCRQAEAAP